MKQTLLIFLINFQLLTSQMYVTSPVAKFLKEPSASSEGILIPKGNRCLYITTFENIVNENKLNLTDKEKIKYEELKRNECK